MYLLIRLAAKIGNMLRSNLHSIMYLLIQPPAGMCLLPLVVFTFHNVSINSFMSLQFSQTFSHLHSIMYLLIPVLQLPLYHL